MTDAPDPFSSQPSSPPTDPQSDPQPPVLLPVTPPAQPQQPASSVGASSTGILMGVEANRRLIVTTLVLVVVAIVGIIASVVIVGGRVAAVNDRLDALEAAAVAAPQEPQAAPAASPTADADAGTATGGAADERVIGTATALSGVEIPAGASPEGAFLVGDPNASNVVEVFVDMQCPYCQRFHAELGETLEQQALTPGSDLLMKVNVISFLGENATNPDDPGASLRAGNAVACVLANDGPQVYADVATAIFAAADPSEPPTQFQTEQLQQLATNAGASEASSVCIADGTFAPFIVESTRSAFARGVQGTPTVVVNGTAVANPFDAPELQSLIQR